MSKFIRPSAIAGALLTLFLTAGADWPLDILGWPHN